MEDEHTVCVATFSSQLQADMARMALDTHGIECFTTADDCGGARPYMQLATGVRLMVLSTEVERASEIITELRDQDG